MKVLIADQDQVTKLFPMDEAIDVMRRTLVMLADKAEEDGSGTWIEIGGRHFGSAAAG